MGSRARTAVAAFVLTLAALPGRPALAQTVGTLTVSPASGQAGQTFTANGGFATGCRTFIVKWDVPLGVQFRVESTQTVTGEVPHGSHPGGHRLTANCYPPDEGPVGIATAEFNVIATPQPVPSGPVTPAPQAPPPVFEQFVPVVPPTTAAPAPDAALVSPPAEPEVAMPSPAATADLAPRRAVDTGDDSDSSGSDSYAGLVVAACLALLLAAVAVVFFVAYRRRRDEVLVVPPVPEMTAKPMPGRDLAEVADGLLGDGRIPALADAGPASSRVAEACSGDAVATPLIATLLWESFVTDERFAQVLRDAGASDRALEDGRVLVVRHAGESRHDLLVLDPDFAGDEATATTVDLRPSAATAADRRELLSWNALLATESGPWPLLDDDTISAAIQEAAETTEFGVVVAASPRVLLSGCPSPAWPVGVVGERAPVATVGAVVETAGGAAAVTTALHAVGDRQSVLVAGRRGTVAGTHEPTDSCLVIVPDLPLNPRGRGRSGPLQGICPAQFDRFAFEGVTSGRTTTTVIGWELGILSVGRNPGARVYSTPETVPGDSGAALVDDDDRIVGFAVSRSAFGEPLEYAAWAWADQVFSVHGVHLRAPAEAVALT